MTESNQDSDSWIDEEGHEITVINGKQYADGDDDHVYPIYMKKSVALEKYPGFDWVDDDDEDDENPDLVVDSFYSIVPWKNGFESGDYSTFDEDFCVHHGIDPKDVVKIGPAAG